MQSILLCVRFELENNQGRFERASVQAFDALDGFYSLSDFKSDETAQHQVR